MCSYKLVTVKFEVWGLQTRVEQFVHKVRGDARRPCESLDSVVLGLAPLPRAFSSSVLSR